MSQLLQNAESEWIAQYAALRHTLAEMKLEQPNDDIKGYGHNIVLDDEDLTGSSGSDDLWNVFSDDEQEGEYSSDIADDITDSLNGKPKSVYSYGHEWFRSKCFAFANSKSGMDTEEVQQQLSAMLASDMRGRDITSLLLPQTEPSYR